MSRAKVMAIWNLGYDGKVRPSGSKFECDLEFAKKKEEQGKLNILDVIEESEEDNDHLVITKMNVEEAQELIDSCNDIEKIKDYLVEESQNKKRKTVINPLEEKMKELEVAGN